jgi:integrase
MPVYPSKTRGKWRVTVYSAGRQQEWTVTGTKEEARVYEAQKRVELRGSTLSTRVSPSFAAFCESVYAPHAVQHLRTSTWSKVRVYQLATLNDYFGPLKLTAITPTVVDAFKIARAKDGVQASSINNELRVLSTVLRFAIKREFPATPPKWERLPQRRSDRIRAWTMDLVMALLEAAQQETPEIVPLLAFIANTGVRKGEAIAAEWSWVNLERGLLEIPVNEAWQPKSGKPREVPISDALRAALSGPRTHERWVHVAAHGGRYLAFPEELWRRARDKAGLSGGPHQLRHSFASLFLQAVPDLFLLGQILGHSTGRMTELYSHLLPGHLDRARNAVSFPVPVKSLDRTLGDE